MERKLPPESFDFYRSLGLKRSYQTVADKYDVSKVSVVNLAKREKWQERLAQLESQAREAGDKKALQSREEMIDHYLKTWQAVERRSLEALRAYPMSSAIDAVRALNMATRNVLLLRGEPTERTESSVEAIIKQQYERWLKPVGSEESPEEQVDDVAGAA